MEGGYALSILLVSLGAPEALGRRSDGSEQGDNDSR